jgi:hypothetical protein
MANALSPDAARDEGWSAFVDGCCAVGDGCAPAGDCCAPDAVANATIISIASEIFMVIAP